LNVAVSCVKAVEKIADDAAEKMQSYESNRSTAHI